MLTALIAIPAVGALLVALLPKGRDALAKQVALGVTLVVAVLSIVMAVQFKTDGPRFQFTEKYWWMKQFGVHYAVGVDGVALVLILLSTILVPLVVLASWNESGRSGGVDTPPKRSVKSYFALLLSLEAMMVGVFAATDVFLFYVFFEAMLIPVYFIIGSYGGAQRSYAAVKFLLYSLFGGLLMLAAVIGLYVVSANAGHGTFLFDELRTLHIAPTTAKWLFLGFFIAFAIKAPLVPFHTWLPDAAGQAPAGAAVLIVGVLDKVGTFGMLRFCLELFPGASKWFTPVVLTLSVIGIVYGAVLAIGQVDIKRLIAYTSVSHFGFITLGIFAMTSSGQSGATLYMVNHGFSTGALFLLAGFMISRRGSARIDAYGGVQKVAPLLAGTFLVAGLSGLSLPGLSSFVSEFMVLVGTFSRYKVPAVIATVGIILAAIYILWMYQRTMNGPTAEAVKGMKDLSKRELIVVAPIIAIIVALGFYPKPVLDAINPSVKQTLIQVHQQDPKPTVAEKGSHQ
ncbi:NADH-quinone oxidoreductase subunit M [Actinoallomurus rhizosphaericola]|uniref:NADH-quinone oxidoreductase subunit M n=1 Tax=Actinoallomurus rhizosphaericola TaxID=2952536 RepID=UPI002090153A|nr:NADH-quinone oxidoreductase subunit M [Actinoallomurus rhizosphaericola]MCO5994545.1 NADH-quinone oxidoreductase subunit M [Actinoallomurus rhizosphaericola]